MQEEVSRADLIKLSARVLTNLAFINSAALAASIAKFYIFGAIHYEPFALGLMAAVISMLYGHIYVEMRCKMEKELNPPKENIALSVFASFVIVWSMIFSGGCIIFGCFRLLAVPAPASALSALIVCMPLLAGWLYRVYRVYAKGGYRT